MESKSFVSISQTRNMTALYLLVAAAFLPWGVVYAVVQVAGWNHWLIAVSLLVLGFVTAKALTTLGWHDRATRSKTSTARARTALHR